MPARQIHGSWTVDFHFGGERCRRRSPLDSREGALAYEMFLRKECALWGSVGAAIRANAPAGLAPCPTLAEFAARWFEAHVAVNNRPKEQALKRIMFRKHLLPEFGSLRLCDIGLEEIERYKGRRKQEGFAAKTINNHLAVLHKCLVSAKEWKAMRTEVPRVPILRSVEPAFRFLSADECDRLLSVAALSPRHGDMVLAGLETGMRFCELSALLWDDVDLAGALVTVRRSALGGHVSAPKNGRIRHIPLTSGLRAALVAVPRTAALVFPNAAGGLMGYRGAWKALARMSAAAGIERVSWHDLRHTFASRLVALGASLLSVQKLLGHSSIEMTMRYSHLGKDALRDAIGLLDGEGAGPSRSHVASLVHRMGPC